MKTLPNEPGIYLITCTANGKTYVGSTQSFRQRWRTHLRKLKCGYHPNRYLQNTFDKYGESTFQFSIIECCPVDTVLEREQYYLDALNPPLNLSPDAYSTRGIKHTDEQRRKSSEAHKKTTKRGSEHHLYGKKASPETLKRMSDSRKGLQLNEETKEKAQIKMKQTMKERYGGAPQRRKVNQIDPLTKEVLATYESMKEASKAVGVTQTLIGNVCANKRISRGNSIRHHYTAGGYLWCYADETYIERPPKYSNSIRSRKVNQLDRVTNVVIATYFSLTDAFKKTGVHETNIQRVCEKRKGFRTAGGYKWCWATESYTESPKYPNSKRKKINQIDPKTGEVFATYPSVSIASEVTGVSRKTICRMCKRGATTIEGYRWEFAD